jgi:hypothetical protein
MNATHFWRAKQAFQYFAIILLYVVCGSIHHYNSYEKFRIEMPRLAVWRYNALFQQTGEVEPQQRVLAKEDGLEI